MNALIRQARQTYGDQFVDEVLMMTENRDPLQVRNYLLDEGNNSLVEILEFIFEIEA